MSAGALATKDDLVALLAEVFASIKASGADPAMLAEAMVISGAAALLRHAPADAPAVFASTLAVVQSRAPTAPQPTDRVH